jgi:lipopolysaccharide transport system permease protein
MGRMADVVEDERAADAHARQHILQVLRRAPLRMVAVDRDEVEAQLSTGCEELRQYSVAVAGDELEDSGVPRLRREPLHVLRPGVVDARVALVPEVDSDHVTRWGPADHDRETAAAAHADLEVRRGLEQLGCRAEHGDDVGVPPLRRARLSGLDELCDVFHVGVRVATPRFVRERRDVTRLERPRRDRLGAENGASVEVARPGPLRSGRPPAREWLAAASQCVATVAAWSRSRKPSVSWTGVSATEETAQREVSPPAETVNGAASAVSGQITRIVARQQASWAAYVREMIRFRDLFYFLVLRDIRVRYSQTVLGFGWSVLQPLLQMVVFSVFFGALAGISSGGVPYPVFSIAAVVPWTYFNNAVTASSTSLITNAAVVNKVYFPRLFIPLSPVAAGFVDHAIALVLLFCVMGVYGIAPAFPALLLLPVLIVLLALVAAGVSIWLAALGGQYRDVRYVTPFVLQLMLFVTPVIYVVSSVPSSVRPFYALNPLVGIVSGFRAVLLGEPAIPWESLGTSLLVSIALLAAGLWYFRRIERAFADIA